LPAAERGARAPLRIGDELVAHWLRVVPAVRPLVVDTGWRTESESACTIVLASTAHARTPEPLREARRLARSARARES
jgi:deoxyribonuclease V